MGLFAKSKPPKIVATLLRPGERVMGWGLGPEQLDGQPTVVVCSNVAFHAPGYTEAILWEDIARANWDDPILEIAAIVEGKPRFTRVNLDQPGAVPDVVYERVTATIVTQQHVMLDGDKGARLVARRPVGSDQIRWNVIFDSGVNAADPKLRAIADDKLRQFRESAGV